MVARQAMEPANSLLALKIEEDCATVLAELAADKTIQ